MASLLRLVWHSEHGWRSSGSARGSYTFVERCDLGVQSPTALGEGRFYKLIAIYDGFPIVLLRFGFIRLNLPAAAEAAAAAATAAAL